MNINFRLKRLTCFFFHMYKIVFYLKQIVVKDMLTAWSNNTKNADFMKLKLTESNQAFVGWGDQDTTFVLPPPSCLLHYWKWLVLCNLLLYRSDAKILFFRKLMVMLPTICEFVNLLQEGFLKQYKEKMKKERGTFHAWKIEKGIHLVAFWWVYTNNVLNQSIHKFAPFTSTIFSS